MKKHILTQRDGATLSIHEIEPGDFACPVCGFSLGNAPAYSEGWVEKADGSRIPIGASASHDICPSCNTEFGFDDYDESLSTEQKWEELRGRWLSGLADKTAAREQLKNIGIELT